MFGRIPAQVNFDQLGRLIIYRKGIEVGSEAYTDSGIPFWRVSNLSKHGLDESNANFISPELYELLRPDYEPQQGEILLSKDTTPGLAYYLEHPIRGIVSSGILRLTITDGIPPHYLELVLNSLFVQMQIEQDAGGSIIKHWKPSEVQTTLIPRLDSEKEKDIARLVEQSHAARREAKALLEKAKRAVEIAIEEGEEKGMESIG
ncbi:restriction endonuclease subunit S [Caldichromatium japonicum]|uniref:Restriction endonuclease subunit S n=1 Tax=Caldichromatium japonicum TaxID=2699430 RepID=A0A6G7V9U9_9GAMM|nr:restriction endonuclease subunit S [Caldichromatium japonicum]QIK36732.1 restriction endonuclease subunit S [Caldichromatium japonicum]